MNAFFKSQFSYCPLLWMCYSLSMNNKINRLHERCLRIVYNDKTSSFVDLFAKDGSVTIHTRYLQVTFLCKKTHYNLRNLQHFAIPIVNSVYHGSESISNLGPRIWSLVSDGLKEPNSISYFKNEIKRWQPEICLCMLYKTYIPRAVFL